MRLGGMALANGVLVHGPKSWACAIRTDDGRIKVAAERKRFDVTRIESPLVRGPIRLLDAMSILPQIRRQLPEARLPFQRPGVLAAMFGSAAVVRVMRSSPNVGPAAQELVSGLLSARACRARAPRLRRRRLPRCGAHLDRHLRTRPAAREGARTVRLAPARPPARNHGARQHARRRASPHTLRTQARLGAQSAPSQRRRRSSAGWGATRNRRLSRALAQPGHELQHRIATAEPTPAQLEVAEAALAACLEPERA